jgi:hypothetical protein
LILIVVAFNLMWPTLPTLVMGPILTTVYVWLALREDRELALRFGEAFRAYAASTPAFLPGRRGRLRSVAILGPADRAPVEAEPVHESRSEG